jgi:hypothetical protein
MLTQIHNLYSESAKFSLLIRHADRDKIPVGKFGNDVLLNEKGKERALNFGKGLSNLKRIFTSPVRRCVQADFSPWKHKNSPISHKLNFLFFICEIFPEIILSGQKKYCIFAAEKRMSFSSNARPCGVNLKDIFLSNRLNSCD